MFSEGEAVRRCRAITLFHMKMNKLNVYAIISPLLRIKFNICNIPKQTGSMTLLSNITQPLKFLKSVELNQIENTDGTGLQQLGLYIKPPFNRAAVRRLNLMVG